MLAAVVAVMLTVQTPLVTPDFALRDTIVVLAGVVLGGHEPARSRRRSAASRSASRAACSAARCRPTQSQYLPSFLFAAVILVLLVRPDGLFTRARERGGARVRRLARARAARGAVRARRRRGAARHASSRRRRETYFIDALVKVAIVVALYVFIGNSGVLSFGHISFVALGAWTAGVLSVPLGEKPAIMPNLAALPRATRRSATSRRCCSRPLVGGVFALVVGLPLMRLSGLAAGIATFAVLEITHNVLRYYEKIGPGLNTFSSVPETTGLWQAAIGALIAIVVAFALPAQPLRAACCARRARIPPRRRRSGISVYRQRLARVRRLGRARGFRGRAVRPPAAAEHRGASISI